MIIKNAYVEGVGFGNLDVKTVEDNPEIQARFASVTRALREEQKKSGVKELSEKVDDFLYASCIMMHAAEASLINQETGEPLLSKANEPVKGWFEKYSNSYGRETVRWVSPDGIKPYRNGNLDIFPEEELVKAHKEWIGKPLCKDHVSNSVDGIRGVIVDTYYDPKFKRVHALFALDRKNYPDLARKVEAGYATNVSMGTGVGRSVCMECQNVATAANEFCNHVRSRTHYGEVNLDLNPIELSIVVTGADSRAKIRKIVASLNSYRDQVYQLKKIKGAPLEELTSIAEEIGSVMSEPLVSEELVEELFQYIKKLSRFDNKDVDPAKQILLSNIEKLVKDQKEILPMLSEEQLGEAIDQLRYQNASIELVNLFKSEYSKKITSLPTTPATKETGEALNTLNVNTAENPAAEDIGLEAPVSYSDTSWSGVPVAGRLASSLIPLKEQNFLNSLEKEVDFVANKLASIKNKWNSLNSSLPKTLAGADTGDCMSFGEIRKRTAMRRKAYLLGTEEPKEYPQMGNQEKIREQDRHMVGDMLDTKVDNPDQKQKEMLLRAELDARRTKRAQMLNALAAGEALKDSSGKTVAIVDGKNVKKVQDGKVQAADDGEAEKEEKTVKSALALELEMLREAAKKKKDVKKDSKGKDKDKDDKSKAKAKSKVDEKDAKKMKSKKAYMLGTEEPKEYPQMGDQEKIRMQDRQMVGDMLDTKVENPDQKQKEMLLRAKLSASLTKSANVADSKWVVLADKKPVFTITAGKAYSSFLNKESDIPGKTWSELFQSREYGLKLLSEAKAGRLGKIAEELEKAENMGMDMGDEADKSAPVDMPELDGAVEEADKAMPMPMDMPVETSADSDMKDRIMGALQKVEECVADLRKAVMGDDEGIENVDVDMAANASLDRGMFEAHDSLVSLASELKFLAEEADLTDEAVVLAARAAVRDARLAQIETMERIAEYEASKEDDCGDMNLDDQDLHEVQEEVKEAIDAHEGDAHSEIAEELSVIEEKVEDIAHEEEELEEALKALREEFESLESGEKEDDAKDGKAEEQKAALAARKDMRNTLVARATSAEGKGTMLDEAHKGENRTIDVGEKVSDDLNVVHDNIETQEKALKTLKLAAAGIADAVRQGKLRDADLDGLAALAAVDPEAVKYYREYYGKVDSTFAKELTEDFKKSASEDLGMRYKRAYNLALEAQGKGFITAGRQALDQFAESLAEGSDSNFEATKRIVAQLKVPQTKTASVMPQIGQVGDDSGTVKVASTTVNVRDPIQLAKVLFGGE